MSRNFASWLLPPFLLLAACASAHGPTTATKKTAPHEYEIRVEGHPKDLPADIQQAFNERAKEACRRDGYAQHRVIRVFEQPGLYEVHPSGQQAGTAAAIPENSSLGSNRNVLDAVVACQ